MYHDVGKELNLKYIAPKGKVSAGNDYSDIGRELNLTYTKPQPPDDDSRMAALAGTLQGITTAGSGVSELLSKIIPGVKSMKQIYGKDPELSWTAGAKKEHPLAEGLGDIAGRAAAAIGPGGALKGASMLSKVLGYGLPAFAEEPGGIPGRAAAGIAGGLGGVLEGLGPIAKKLPAYMSLPKLAKLIEKTHSHMEDVGEQLYAKAFKGTGDVKPKLSNETITSFYKLLKIKPGGLKIQRAIARFTEDQNPNSLHRLKSDLGKMHRELETTSGKRGLFGEEGDQMELLEDAKNGINKDLKSTMQKLAPNKYNQYLHAQIHHRENIIPFRKYPAIRNLLGPEREIGSGLKTSLMKKSREDAGSAAKLRAMMGLKTSGFETAKQLKKLSGYAGPAALAYTGLRSLKDIIGENR